MNDFVPVAPRIHGYCVMGCGQTLKIDDSGRIRCTDPTCGYPTAAAEILANPEHEHIVEMRQDGYVLQHPLKERLADGWFACSIHEALRDHLPPPPGVEVERYRITLDSDGDLYWVSLDPPADDPSVKAR